MNKRKNFILCSIFVFLLLIINLWIFLHRHDGYAYTELLNYNQLYEISEADRIVGFERQSENSLLVKISSSLKNTSWLVKYDNGDSSVINNSNFPVLKFSERIHHYEIKFLNHPEHPAISLDIDYSPKNIYEEKGNSIPTNYEISNSSVPIGNYKLYGLSEWKYKNTRITQEEIKEAKKILETEIEILSTDNSLIKIEKIGKYVLDKLQTEEGIPNDVMNKLSPLNQFRFVCSKKSKLWCGNYAGIFNFFADCANIPARMVSIEGNLDEVDFSKHIFSECYIREQNRWAFVDLNSRKLNVRNLEGMFLNTVDLLNINTLKNYETITALCYNNGKTDTIPYEEVNQSEKHFFSNNAKFVFYFSEINTMGKIKSYISANPYFAVYSNTVAISNAKFYLKIFLFYLLLFSSLALIILAVKLFR